MSIQRVKPWAALIHRDFQLYFTHGVLMGISRNLRDTLLYLMVYQLSGSALQLGLTGLFQAVPVIIAGLLGGAMADSYNRRMLMLVTQVATLLSGVVLVALIVFGHVQVWHLWAMGAFWSAANTLGRPAQRAYMPRLVPEQHLMNAITWYGTLNQGTLFIGPILGAGVMAWAGPAWAFGTDLALLGVGFIAIALIRANGRPEGTGRGVSLRTIWEGFNYVRTRQALAGALTMDFGVMSFGFFRPLTPILALDVYGMGEVGVGILNGAPAVGSILGTFVLLVLGDVRRKGLLVVGANLGYVLGLGLLGLSALLAPGWVVFALVALAGLGLADAVSFTARQALIQIVAVDAYRGRAASLSSIIAQLGNATGASEMGAVAAVAGAPGALLINCAIGVGMVGGITLLLPGLRRQGAEAPAPAPATSEAGG